MFTIPAAKSAARRLRAALARTGVTVGHSASLELVAQQLGSADWNTYVAQRRQRFAAVPVLRSFDERVARRFYLDYLGFGVVFEHRFQPGMPLYLRVERDGMRIDLSEHHGDGTPGSSVWVETADLEALHAELSARQSAGIRPGIDPDAPGGPTMNVIDPFGNTLRFCQPA